MIIVGVSVVEACDALCHGFGFGPVHFIEGDSGVFNRRGFFRLHQFKIGFTHAHVNQKSPMGRQRILGRPVLKQVTVDITCRSSAWISEVQIVMVVGMATSPHGLHVDKGRTATFQSKLSSNGGGSVPSRRVRAVNGPRWETHSARFVSPNFDARLLSRGRIKSNLIVLKNVRDGKPASACKVHRFPKFAG